MSENKSIDPKLAETLKGIYDSLTDEQKEKAKACKTMDELIALAAKEGRKNETIPAGNLRGADSQ